VELIEELSDQPVVCEREALFHLLPVLTLLAQFSFEG